jgi:hypothetical protein
LASWIRAYLQNDPQVWSSDDYFTPLHQSADATVHYVMDEMGMFLDEYPEPVNKEGWDYLQRLLLLLESEHTVRTTRRYRWRGSQAVAAAALLSYAGLYSQFNWSWPVWLAHLPLALLVYAIAETNLPPQRAAYYRILHPFRTFAQLKAVYDSTRGFKKERFVSSTVTIPPRAAWRILCERLAVWVLTALGIALLCLFAPMLLLYFCFPQCETSVEIIPSPPHATQN